MMDARSEVERAYPGAYAVRGVVSRTGGGFWVVLGRYAGGLGWTVVGESEASAWDRAYRLLVSTES